MWTCGEMFGRSWLHLSFGLRGGFNCVVFEAGRRQKRRTLVLMGALLHFHFGEEHGGSNGGDRYLAAFRTADAVEDMRLIARSENAGERSERRANDVHAANQFVRP